MKYLISVLMGGATIIVAITTAIAQAHQILNGNASLISLRPYLLAYAFAAILLIIAGAMAISAGREERKTATDDKHKEIKSRLAVLLAREREIFASLKSASDNAQFTELIRKADEWVNEVAALLKEADQPTDAEMFCHVGHLELSSEQLARCSHIPDWKRDVVVRQLLYRQTLDQIKSNRRF